MAWQVTLPARGRLQLTAHVSGGDGSGSSAASHTVLTVMARKNSRAAVARAAAEAASASGLAWSEDWTFWCTVAAGAALLVKLFVGSEAWEEGFKEADRRARQKGHPRTS